MPLNQYYQVINQLLQHSLPKFLLKHLPKSLIYLPPHHATLLPNYPPKMRDVLLVSPKWTTLTQSQLCQNLTMPKWFDPQEYHALPHKNPTLNAMNLFRAFLIHNAAAAYFHHGACET
jgi:hypothetical protein